MQIKFACSKCNKHLEVDAAAGGKQITCPNCNAQVTIPEKNIGPGFVVGGFRIDQLLERGGMGEVYLATQLSMDRRVALKILPQFLTSDPALIQQFMHEVRVLAKLDHPNIVTAYEAGDDGGVYYLAMKYVEGENLAHRLQTQGPFVEREALRIALCVARALQYSWERHGILHHDIKPANIILDPNNEVFLTDVGISTVFRERREPGGAILEGTPEYMSPERIHGKGEPDPRSDMYSLGITLYELLSGTLPFTAPTPEEVMQMQEKAQPPSLRRRNPAVSENCQRLVEWMMIKSPSARHANWEVLIADFQRVQLRRAPLGTPLSASEASLLAAVKSKSKPRAPSESAASVASAPSPAPGRPAAPIRPAAPSRPAMPGRAPAPAPKPAAAAQPAAAAGKEPAPAGPFKPSAMPSLPGLALMAALLVGIIAAMMPAQKSGFGRWVRGWVDSGPKPVTPADELGDALNYVKENPNDYTGGMRRLETVYSRYEGRPEAVKARSEFDRISAERQEAMRKVMTDLKEEADRLFAQRRYEEAIALVTDYNGALVNDTAEQRDVLAESLKRKKTEIQDNEAASDAGSSGGSQ